MMERPAAAGATHGATIAARRAAPDREPDAFLVAKGVLSREDFIEVVDGAAEVEGETAGGKCRDAVVAAAPS